MAGGFGILAYGQNYTRVGQKSPKPSPKPSSVLAFLTDWGFLVFLFFFGFLAFYSGFLGGFKTYFFRLLLQGIFLKISGKEREERDIKPQNPLRGKFLKIHSTDGFIRIHLRRKGLLRLFHSHGQAYDLYLV